MRMCLFMRCSHSRMPVVVHTPPEECEQEQSARASRCKTHCWGGRRLWVQQCVFRLQKITKGLYIQPFSKVISIVSSPFSDGQKTTRNQIQALGDASNFGITTERGDDQPPAITTVVILPLRYLLLPAAPTSHHGIQLTHRPFREQVCIHRPRREPPPALSSPLPSPPPAPHSSPHLSHSLWAQTCCPTHHAHNPPPPLPSPCIHRPRRVLGPPHPLGCQCSRRESAQGVGCERRGHQLLVGYPCE